MDELAARAISLYLVTDRRITARPIVEVLDECLAAGLRAVQLREKDLPVRELLTLATSVREVSRRYQARLVVNDRADVALAVGADGVQRTHVSLPVSALRTIAPPGFLVGASVHGADGAIEAEREGADFIVFGPVYDTPSKRPYGPPQGLLALERVTAAVSRPVLAIGGVTPGRVAEVRRAGAAGVAAISAVLGADRPADAVKAFLDALAGA